MSDICRFAAQVSTSSSPPDERVQLTEKRLLDLKSPFRLLRSFLSFLTQAAKVALWKLAATGFRLRN
jgi:hypothetical protein